jgi:RimJ/RimL family protein N-acetyltransferase
MMTVLTTKRLSIRPLTLADAASVQSLITEKISIWTAPIPWPHHLENAEWWINNTDEDNHTGIFLEHVLVGSVSIPRQDGDEVGFWVNGAYEGRGIATEAASAVIEHVFRAKALAWLDSKVHRDNLASRRIHEKLGFAAIAETVSFWRNRNAEVPVVHYRLKKTDWQG